VGRKKAEQLILDLAEKMNDLAPALGSGLAAVGEKATPVAENAVRALVSLGYAAPDAERAVKSALDAGGAGMSAPDLIREALAKVTDARR
jgi:Holliday junction DNA helicase RuvA